ncbi:MAG: KdsC family phosphatase, partial [Planctomycetota bacterium]
SEPTQRRAEQLQIDYVFEDCHDKLPFFKEFLEKEGLPPERTAYIGDDLTDLPLIRYVGFGVAVANAVDEVKRYADYVTSRPGGRGAVREVIEHILKSSDKWRELMKYLP